MTKSSLIIILLLCISFISVRSTLAAMESSSYILDLDSDTSNDQSTSRQSEAQIITAPDKNTPSLVVGDDYTAQISYDNDNKNLPLILTTSSDVLNFGEIKPGEPIIRTHSLTILPGSSQGYQVISYQDHNFESDGAEIPGTSCDSGSCSPILSDVWSIPLTYGFGYRCDNLEGTSCDISKKKEFYKRFANEKADEFPTSILQEEKGTKSEAVISYKINIPGTQPNKGYQTSVYHIVTPDL